MGVTASSCWLCHYSQFVHKLLTLQTNLLLQDSLITKNAIWRITPPCPWGVALSSPAVFTVLLTARGAFWGEWMRFASGGVSLWWARQVKLLLTKHVNRDTEPCDPLNHWSNVLNNTNSCPILAHNAISIIFLKGGISMTILLKKGGTFCWEAVF